MQLDQGLDVDAVQLIETSLGKPIPDFHSGDAILRGGVAGGGGGEDVLVGFTTFRKVFQQLAVAAKSNNDEDANAELKVLLSRLGVDAGTTPAWVVHDPGPASEQLHQAVVALSMSTPAPSSNAQRHRDNTPATDAVGNSEVTHTQNNLSTAATVPAPVRAVTQMHHNPVLLDVKPVRSRNLRPLGRIEQALAVLFKDSTRFNSFRKQLHSAVASKNKNVDTDADTATAVVTKLDLFGCLKGVVDKKSSLYRKHGRDILFTKEECQAMLDRVVELLQQQRDLDLDLSLDEEESQDQLVVNEFPEPTVEAVLVYMRIFRPGHLRNKGSLKFREWHKDVAGDTGRFNPTFKLQQALAGDLRATSSAVTQVRNCAIACQCSCQYQYRCPKQAQNICMYIGW